MSGVKLNLARKWRSQNFDQIVGQDLPMRMLKNSLYLDHYFPVYLFSGQRGCGKTSAARIFAAAVNCEHLPAFQKDPQNTLIPCLQCVSCTAMMQAQHPDFFEIDAASHTGVDNVRNLIDASSLLPLMGRKKVYLIDEAHMLSKAAFNAFLKILEEPPASVLFMLATTDAQKIIETVKSRCFQLFFKPVEVSALRSHLLAICKAENIVAEDTALDLIIQETNGSVRDAINMIEQVRFATSEINRNSVMQSLGYISDEKLITLVKAVLCKDIKTVTHFFADHAATFATDRLCNRTIDLLCALIRMKYGVFPAQFADHYTVLKSLADACSIKRLCDVSDNIVKQMPVISQTTAQQAYFEHLLLQLALNKAINDDDNNENNNSPSSHQQASPSPVDGEHLTDEECDEDEIDDEDDVDQEDETVAWNNFLLSLAPLQEPLLVSIFSQAEFKKYDASTGALALAFSKDLTFFKDWLHQTEQIWKPLLQKTFGSEVSCAMEFTKDSVAINAIQKITPAAMPNHPVVSDNKSDASRTVPQVKQPVNTHNNSFKQSAKAPYASNNAGYRKKPLTRTVGTPINVSDTSVWQKTHMIMRYFPGCVIEVRS